MLTWPLILAALAAGLIGGVHCVGMCGGLSQWLLPAPRGRQVIPIMAAASGGEPGANAITTGNGTHGANHANRPAMSALVALHAGRLTTYAVIGALAGASGGAALSWRQVPHWPLFLLGNLALLYLGLRLAGWRWPWPLPPRWQVLTAKLLRWLPRPANYPPLVNGLAWGCMPCGLLYSVLPFALLSGAAWSGALLMWLFGLAGLPHLLMLPLAGRASRRWPKLRPLAASLLVIWSLFGLLQMGGLIPALTTVWCIAG